MRDLRGSHRRLAMMQLPALDCPRPDGDNLCARRVTAASCSSNGTHHKASKAARRAPTWPIPQAGDIFKMLRALLYIAIALPVRLSQATDPKCTQLSSSYAVPNANTQCVYTSTTQFTVPADGVYTLYVLGGNGGDSYVETERSRSASD